MTFRFSRQGLTPREQVLERAFEILPGITSWTVLVGMVGLAFWNPLLAAMVVIAFDLYWLLRLFYMTMFLILSSMRLSIEAPTDWMARVRAFEPSGHAPPTRVPTAAQWDLKSRCSLWMYRRELRAIRRQQLSPPPADAIHHVVIFPIAEERREVLEPGIESLIHQTFPPARVLVILAVEERADPEVKVDAAQLQQVYRTRFLDLLIVTHPDRIPGEARVKGANATWAAHAAAAYLQDRGIPFAYTLISCFDADTTVSPQYLACLTYRFMACSERTRASFQPIPVYHNNIWEVPAFARILDIGSSFFQLIEATHPDRLVTFSSHSMSFQALIDVGYWPVDLISDDSAIFWKAFLHYDGHYRVVPLYITVSMDVAAAETWRKTIVNVYKQKRRWAWGVENFPIVMRGFLRDEKIPLFTKIRHGFKLFEGHVAWATWAFLLTVIGWIPALLAGREFPDSVVYYSAPRITATIFHLSSVVLLTTVVLSYCLLPKERITQPFLKRIGLALEWLLVPLVSLLLAALPALDAQTRLMFGRYLEFWVTEKPHASDGHCLANEIRV